MRPLERSLAAVVVPINVIAITTMASPRHRRGAHVEPGVPAGSTGLPSPGPSTRAAMVAMDGTDVIDWLMPTTIVRRGIGGWTWRSICLPVSPMERAASTVVPDTVLIPCSVIRTSGGSA